MNRRRLLALLGGASGLPLAGCLGDGSDAPGTSTATPPPSETGTVTRTTRTRTADATTTPTGTASSTGPVERRTGESYEPPGGGRVRVASPRVRRSVLLARGSHAELSTPEGQYLVVDLTVEPPSDGWFEPAPRRSLALPGTGAAGGSFVVGEGPEAFVTPAYESSRAGLALPAPVREYEEPAVVWPREPAVRWRLPEAVAGRLAAAPAFEVTALAARRREGEVRLELGVRNDGGRDGEFLARVRVGGGSSDVWSTHRIGVPAGAERTLAAAPRSVADAAVGATLDVSYTGGEATVTVTE